MKKRIIQIFAVIFAVGILASCLIVPAAAADQVDLYEYYDGMVRDAIDINGGSDNYTIKSNLANYYTVKQNDTIIAFENNGYQTAWAYWQTPNLNADGCVFFVQDYAVFDNKIPQITYQFIPTLGEKIQVARFTTGGKLYYLPSWIGSHTPNDANIVTFQPSDSDQICAFRDVFSFDPYAETLTIERWYYTNGNYDAPAYKFVKETRSDLCFKQDDGTFVPSDFRIRGYIQHTDEYFATNVCQIQMTRQVVRTWRLSPTRDEIISLRMDWADLELENKTLRGQVASLEEGLYQMQMNREEEVAEYEARIKTAVDEIVNLRNYNQHLNGVNSEQEATIKDLRDGLDNTNAIGVFLDGIFGGVRNLIVPWFDLGIGGITIGSILGVFGILLIIVVVVKLVRG